MLFKAKSDPAVPCVTLLSVGVRGRPWRPLMPIPAGLCMDKSWQEVSSEQEMDLHVRRGRSLLTGDTGFRSGKTSKHTHTR